MTSFTPRSPARSTSGGKTFSAIRRFSATDLPGSRPTNVPTVGQPSSAAASTRAFTWSLIARRSPSSGCRFVVVERERREGQSVLLEQRPHPVRVGLPEGLGLQVRGGEGPVPEVRPRGDLEGFETVFRGPGGDVVERPVRQARGQESELHAGTSIQESFLAESITASVITAARRPSEKVGTPSRP